MGRVLYRLVPRKQPPYYNLEVMMELLCVKAISEQSETFAAPEMRHTFLLGSPRSHTGASQW